MPVAYQHMTDGGYIEVRLSGKLTASDYESFVPETEQLITEYGRLRILVLLEDFHGWTGSGLWEDIKFDVKHFRDIDRVAIVGERRWHELMAQFCRPFTTAKIRYFEHRELAEARAWLTGAEQPAAHTTTNTSRTS